VALWFRLLWIVSFCVFVDLFFNFVPIGLGGRLAVPSRAPIPSPGQLLGSGAAAVVGQVGLADRPGLYPVGHGLPTVVRPGDPVYILHHTAVDL